MGRLMGPVLKGIIDHGVGLKSQKCRVVAINLIEEMAGYEEDNGHEYGPECLWENSGRISVAGTRHGRGLVRCLRQVSC